MTWFGGPAAWQARSAGEKKLNTLGASCAEPSEARLRAADESMIIFVIVKVSEGSEGEDELQSASLLPSCVKRCFVFIPLARFPFLLSQVCYDSGLPDGRPWVALDGFGRLWGCVGVPCGPWWGFGKRTKANLCFGGHWKAWGSFGGIGGLWGFGRQLSLLGAWLELGWRLV